MRIAYTDNFTRAWKRLTEKEKTAALKAIEHLLLDMRYPALRVKKIKGTEYIWEARVNRSIRMTFQKNGDILILRNVGHHDEALGKP
jgi:mRNA-degrading endonuclease RelE of RelBE toxin-antitoxin system